MSFRHPAPRRHRYAIVSVDEARRRTGLELEQLLSLRDVELLTREIAGVKEQALRLPVELVSAE